MTQSTQSMTQHVNDSMAGSTQGDRDRERGGDREDVNSSSPTPVSLTDPRSRPLLRPPSSARLPLSLPPPLPVPLAAPKLPGPLTRQSMSSTSLPTSSSTAAATDTATAIRNLSESTDKDKEGEGRGRVYSNATMEGRRQNTADSSISDSDSNPRPSIYSSTSNGSSTYVTPTKSSDGRDGIQGSRSGDTGVSVEKEREMRRVAGNMSNSSDIVDEEMKSENAVTVPSRLTALQPPSRSPSLSPSQPLSPPAPSPDSLDRRKALRRSFTDPSGLGVDGSRVLQAPPTLSAPGIPGTHGSKAPPSPAPVGETAVSRRLHAAAAARKLAEENGGVSPLPPSRSMTISPNNPEK